MRTQTAYSTAETAPHTAPQSAFYYHQRYEALECMGCFELIEVPCLAVIKQGQMPVRIKGNPEHLLIWRELMELDHAKCASFEDLRMAQDARKYRRVEQRRVAWRQRMAVA